MHWKFKHIKHAVVMLQNAIAAERFALEVLLQLSGQADTTKRLHKRNASCSIVVSCVAALRVVAPLVRPTRDNDLDCGDLRKASKLCRLQCD